MSLMFAMAAGAVFAATGAVFAAAGALVSAGRRMGAAKREKSSRLFSSLSSRIG